MALSVRNGDNIMINRNTLGRKSVVSLKNDPRKRKTFQTFKKTEPRNISLVPEREVEKRVQDLPVVPDGIRNIDETEEGSQNPQLCAEYTPLMYSYLRELEEAQSIKKDFLRGLHINGRIRSVLIDWLIEVHNQFKLLQETLYLAIFMLDRYMTLDGQSVKRNRYQLVGVTALFTASKIEEMYPPEIRDFVYITDNSFSVLEIRQMELRMLSTLNFGLGRPLPLHFLRRYSKAGEVDIVQHTVAKYLIELSQIEYDLAHIYPSHLSAAALYLALHIISTENVEEAWTPTLQYYSKRTKQQLAPVVNKMAAVAYAAPRGQFQAVYKKYCSKTKLRVALLPELKGEKIKALMRNNLKSTDKL